MINFAKITSFRIHSLDFLLYGNLLLFILNSIITNFFSFNIYLLGSLAVNIVVISALNFPRYVGVNYISTFALIFFSGLVGIITVAGKVEDRELLSILIRFSFFLTSVVAVHNVFINTDSEIFSRIRKFFIFSAHIILIDIIISYLFNDGFYVPEEGLQTFLLNPAVLKYFSLMVMPFLLVSGWRYFLHIVVFAISMYLGTRALVMAASFLFVFMAMVYFINNLNRHRRILKIHGIVLSLLLIVVATNFVNQTRSISFLNTSSLIARTVVWGNYLTSLKDYPFGLGPQGIYFFLRYEGYKSNFGKETLYWIFERKNVDKRTRILGFNKSRMSAESLHIEFISAYGLVGLLIWIHLAATFLKDMVYSMLFRNREFTIIYISFSSVLLYGLFNSFHLGGFLLVFLYFSYFRLRKGRIF